MNNTNNENDKIRAKILNLEKYKLELERVQAKITCEDETSLAKIKKICLEAALTTTLHGLSNIFNTNKISLKLIWTIALIISSIGCLYFIASNIFDFERYDVITETRIVRPTSMEFPTFYICNRRASTVPFNKILYKCNYDNLETCDLTDFEPFDLKQSKGQIKKCVRFNSGFNSSKIPTTVRSIDKVGYEHSLHLKFYLQENDFINYYVSRSTVIPISGEIYRFLDGGKVSNVVITKLVEEKLGHPYNKCKHLKKKSDYSSDLYKATIDQNITYRQINCFDLCYFESIAKTCDCSFTGIYELPNKPSCLSTVEIKQCVDDNYEGFDFNIKCSDQCPLECESTVFGLTAQSIIKESSPQDLESSRELISLNRNISDVSDDELNSRILNLFIFFEDLKYTEIRQIAKTTQTDLVSKIGGTLGFFLGLSLLSFVEFIDLGLKILYFVRNMNTFVT